MNIFVKTGLIAAALCSSVAASASTPQTFDFSYVFSDGQSLTGSFTGVTSDGGLTVSGISNLQASFNGIAFAGGVGPLQLNGWSTSAESFTDNTPVVISANAAQNNFSISDVDAAVNTSPDYEFVMLNDPNVNAGTEVVAANFLQSDAYSGPGATQLDIDTSANKWSLVEVAPTVPEPASLPLFIAALVAILGPFRSIRRNNGK